jgi:hypothetical protein
VSDGDVVTGPGTRPVFAIDSSGSPWTGLLEVSGFVRTATDSIAIASWNRASPTGLAWYDRNFGDRVDTATGSIRVPLGSVRVGSIGRADSGGAVPIPSGGGVLSVSRTAPDSLRSRLTSLAAGGVTAQVEVRLLPFHPREAVGGFPVLVRDSVEAAGLDSAGAATFGPVRHPRTIVAFASRGRRLMLVTVDGRQPGYSVGMTLREAAGLALDLGATDAINLDGGGSTAMVVRRGSSGTARYEVVNRPSDPQGERPVGNALAVVCNQPR